MAKKKIEGWVAKYGPIGNHSNAYIFSKGCFDCCDGREVPIFLGFLGNIIGRGKLSVKDEGLYLVGTIHDSNIEKLPNRFTLAAYKVCLINNTMFNADVKLVGLSDKSAIESSSIEKYED